MDIRHIKYKDNFSYCGETLNAWHFPSIQYAYEVLSVYSIAIDGKLIACQKCVDQIHNVLFHDPH
jgi:hypothetical protein